MRRSKADFEARNNGNWAYDFAGESLSSYAGLELFSAFLRRIQFSSMMKKALKDYHIPGDVSASRMILLLIGMLLVGAKRLAHVDHLKNDPLCRRFSQMPFLPHRTTLARFLVSFSYRTWELFDRISDQVIVQTLQELKPRRLTLDVDGTVLSTGLKVERARRGFNPHHRKNPSYYPLTACLAQTGQVVSHKNRSGNVHDSRGSAAFVQKSVQHVRTQLDFSGIIEIRTNSAFFQRDLLEAYDRLGVEYATKVPMAPWLNFRKHVVDNSDKFVWADKSNDVQALDLNIHIKPWDRNERIVIYRKKIHHKPASGLQLDLFKPDDGFWEYCAVATNRDVNVRRLWDFMNGRGAQELSFRELKGGLAFKSIPTQTYAANTAWQKINILTLNLVRCFQVNTDAEARPRSYKRTNLVRLETIPTLRFKILNKAARVIKKNGRTLIRMNENAVTRSLFTRLEQRLAA